MLLFQRDPPSKSTAYYTCVRGTVHQHCAFHVTVHEILARFEEAREAVMEGSSLGASYGGGL